MKITLKFQEYKIHAKFWKATSKRLHVLYMYLTYT